MKMPQEKKTIAFVSNNGWTMYNFRKEVLQQLVAAGYDVLIIAGEDRYASQLVSIGCRFVAVSFNNRSLNPVHDIRFFLALKRIYKNCKPGFIFHYVAKPNIYGTLAAGYLNIPSIAVITGLGHAFNKKDLLKWMVVQLYRFSLQFAREVWCLNNEDAEVLVNNGIVPVPKLKVLPGEGIDTDHFCKREGESNEGVFTFLMSARLLKSKGILDYADATLILKKKNYSFKSYLLGAREVHPDAVAPAQIYKWQQERGIHYLGFADDVRPYLGAADCFVYPSFYHEGVPRSLMEACSMELPVITTNNAGCKDLIEDGVNGFICNKQERFHLAERMEAMLLLKPAIRRQMGIKSREIVSARFSSKMVGAFYQQVLHHYFAAKQAG